MKSTLRTWTVTKSKSIFWAISIMVRTVSLSEILLRVRFRNCLFLLLLEVLGRQQLAHWTRLGHPRALILLPLFSAYFQLHWHALSLDDAWECRHELSRLRHYLHQVSQAISRIGYQKNVHSHCFNLSERVLLLEQNRLLWYHDELHHWPHQQLLPDALLRRSLLSYRLRNQAMSCWLFLPRGFWSAITSYSWKLLALGGFKRCYWLLRWVIHQNIRRVILWAVSQWIPLHLERHV